MRVREENLLNAHSLNQHGQLQTLGAILDSSLFCLFFNLTLFC